MSPVDAFNSSLLQS